ncbi:AAA family ATPase [Streptomyces paromomycinus]|uniref:ATP/GTP-binding protein n=1 Tax=Streptomyces paromomycinus TaxID=92743 RepID=A0A401WGI7_STREY|nr:AAA family ATPase [Streptomyces paromomycinus]GCD48425.1 ATP/GTP-binding protein [Streptomyces paromomycinus]
MLSSKNSTRADRDRQILDRARAAPMAPRWVFTLQGWNNYVHEMVELPDLAASHPPGTPVLSDDVRLRYHGHLRMVSHPLFDKALLKTSRLLLANGNRREGLLDRVIDGPPGTGKTFLLRVIGREFQRSVEDRQGGHENQIPVVHVAAPQDPENVANWVWEIADFLGLTPAPRDVEELLQVRRIPDLSQPVWRVMERSSTRLLLVDGLQRVHPDHLVPFLAYMEKLREELGISTIFCGTGSRKILQAAQDRAVHTSEALQGLAERASVITGDDGTKHPLLPQVSPSRLPVTWLDPVPLYSGDQETWPSILRGFEENLCLHRLSEHALVKEAKYLHARTGGYFKLLSQLICQAAMAAIEIGSEDITRELLEDIDIGG